MEHLDEWNKAIDYIKKFNSQNQHQKTSAIFYGCFCESPFDYVNIPIFQENDYYEMREQLIIEYFFPDEVI